MVMVNDDVTAEDKVVGTIVIALQLLHENGDEGSVPQI